MEGSSSRGVLFFVLIVLGIGLGIGAVMALKPRPSTEAPQPSQSDAQRMVVPAEGLVLTIKQKSNAYLPGGKAKLHLDDITGRQVLVSVTDDNGHVILGPKSVKVDDVFDISVENETHQVEVVRLKNMLAGGDFGEFRVKRK